MKVLFVIGCLLAAAAAQRPGGGIGGLIQNLAGGFIGQLAGQGQTGSQGTNGQNIFPGITGTTTPAPAECFPGQRFERDCNTCTCINGRIACTLIDCSAQTTQNQCREGQRVQQQCNTCTCTGGRFQCTDRFCLGGGDVDSEFGQVPQQLEGGFCRPGQSFQQDCNTCFCENGRFACSRRACGGGFGQQQQEGGFCRPGQTFQRDCNTCFCENGRFACSRRACVGGFGQLLGR